MQCGKQEATRTSWSVGVTSSVANMAATYNVAVDTRKRVGYFMDTHVHKSTSTYTAK